MKKQALKKMPSLHSDEEAENFVDTVDLSQYDLSGFTPVAFEFESKSTTLNMRLSKKLLTAVKMKAQSEGMPYTRFIRLLLEKSL